jgi:hypothetical protein
MRNCDLDIDLSLNYKQIAAQININLLKLYRLQQQYGQLQTEIDAFLDNYYAAITPHLLPYFAKNPHHNDVVVLDIEAEYCSNFEKILKQLYRSLAKHFHPDLSGDASYSIMTKLNAAYENKELGSLLIYGLQFDLADDVLRLSVDDLLHYQQLLKAHTTELTLKLQHLQQSEANVLRQLSLQARLEGRNIEREVVHKLKNKYQYAV